jgi:hypothetical protein
MSSMKLSSATAVVAAAGLLAGPGALAAAPVGVTVIAPGHTSTVGKHWNYTVKVTRGGNVVAGKITEAIVDPIGGSHPVEFGSSTRKITNWPFNGVFRDFIIWPASSRGIPLTLRITVQVGSARKVVNYSVTPGG